MEPSNKLSKESNKENKSTKQNPIIENLKSDYFLQKLYDNMTKEKKLEIVRYNKRMQYRLNLNIKDYKEYSETFTPIVIELVPSKDKYGRFININENDKPFYHIYFNDNEEEIKNKYEIKEEDKVTKIKTLIDYQVKSFKELFYDCECIQSINFKKFYRNNITDISFMFNGSSSLKELNLINFNTDIIEDMQGIFQGCSSLKELNLTNFNTNNVRDMSCMFNGCSSLEKLNLRNFNTNNVIYMSFMFYGCSSLKELNLTNFNTENVIYMRWMFSRCSSLEELNLTNFNTSNVIDMSWMFSECSSLKKLNLTNFNTSNVTDMRWMFSECPYDLKRKIKSENKNFRDEAFDD
jgi:surface protein